MRQYLDGIVDDVSAAQRELANILEAERGIAVRMSEIISSLPDVNPDFAKPQGILEFSGAVCRNIVAYLNSLADLQESAAEQLMLVIRQTEPVEE